MRLDDALQLRVERRRVFAFGNGKTQTCYRLRHLTLNGLYVEQRNRGVSDFAVNAEVAEDYSVVLQLVIINVFTKLGHTGASAV